MRASCTCPDADFAGRCKHVFALAYVVAAAIDEDPADPARMARLRPGRAPRRRPRRRYARRACGRSLGGGLLPELGPPRPLPVGSVLKRLGDSGLVVDGIDLREALEPAYAAFARGNATVDG